jgi:hypothetical protein
MVAKEYWIRTKCQLGQSYTWRSNWAICNKPGHRDLSHQTVFPFQLRDETNPRPQRWKALLSMSNADLIHYAAMTAQVTWHVCLPRLWSVSLILISNHGRSRHQGHDWVISCFYLQSSLPSTWSNSSGQFDLQTGQTIDQKTAITYATAVWKIHTQTVIKYVVSRLR